MPTIIPFDTLTDLYVNLSKKYAGQNKAVFHHKLDTSIGFEPVYWDQVTEDVQALAGYLVSKGIKNGDPVGILSENRYEWAVVDLAIQLLGGINVSLYTTLPPNQCEYILQDSQAKIFFVSTGIQLKNAVEVFENCPELEEVVAFEMPKNKKHMEHDFVRLFDHAMREGKKL